jgi:hypothetical protein
MPAYAGLQDWDALYNFDYSSNANGVAWPSAGGSTFSISSDPIGLIGDRLAAMVFLRGDVAPAKNRIGFAVQADTAFASLQTPFPSTFSKLGLVTGIGSAPALPETLLEEQSLAAVVVASADEHGEAGMPIYSANDELGANLMSDGILPAGSISPDGAGFVSDTGQTELRTDEGTLKVVTPRSELFVLPAQTQLNGDFASVRNGDTFCSVAVVAVDGQPLVESSRLLIAHLTDVLPTGVLFDSSDRKIQESVGRLPLLVRRGSCELTLKLAPDGDYRAWVVSSTGARLREVPLSRTDEGWVLQASTVTPEGTQLAYEIQRN